MRTVKPLLPLSSTATLELSNMLITHVACAAGLSDSFIQIDDDWLLTRDWTMADFVRPDGGQTLTGREASLPGNTTLGLKFAASSTLRLSHETMIVAHTVSAPQHQLDHQLCSARLTLTLVENQAGRKSQKSMLVGRFTIRCLNTWTQHSMSSWGNGRAQTQPIHHSCCNATG